MMSCLYLNQATSNKNKGAEKTQEHFYKLRHPAFLRLKLSLVPFASICVHSRFHVLKPPPPSFQYGVTGSQSNRLRIRET